MTETFLAQTPKYDIQNDTEDDTEDDEDYNDDESHKDADNDKDDESHKEVVEVDTFVVNKPNCRNLSSNHVSSNHLSSSEISLRAQLSSKPKLEWAQIEEILSCCLHSPHSIEVFFALLAITGARKTELLNPEIDFTVAGPQHWFMTKEISHRFSPVLFVQSWSHKSKERTPIVRPCLVLKNASELIQTLHKFRKQNTLSSKMYTVPHLHEVLQRLFPGFCPSRKDTYHFCRKLYANATHFQYRDILQYVSTDKTLWLGTVLGHKHLKSSLHYQDVDIYSSNKIIRPPPAISPPVSFPPTISPPVSTPVSPVSSPVFPPLSPVSPSLHLSCAIMKPPVSTTRTNLKKRTFEQFCQTKLQQNKPNLPPNLPLNLSPNFKLPISSITIIDLTKDKIVKQE